MTDCSQNCGGRFSHGLAATLRVISGKWKPQVLYFLLDGPKRYGEVKRTIQGVSDKVLIQQLKDLEADHVLARTDYKEVPPRVDYALTRSAAAWPSRSSRFVPGEPRTWRKLRAFSPSATLYPSRILKNR